MTGGVRQVHNPELIDPEQMSGNMAWADMIPK